VGFLGPGDPLRSTDSGQLFEAASHAAHEAGVTRLADITRLDRIGLPVWQAVRPLSRALSVHQVKGATPSDARLGALLEAVESHAAELFAKTALTCAFDGLPEAKRAPSIADFAADRDSPPSASERAGWVAGETLPGFRDILLPLPLVGLDLASGPTAFDRSSNGVATGASYDEAVFVALHELIERDSIVEWLAADMAVRMESSLEPRSIPFGWFFALRDRIESAGASLACYRVPSVTGTPVFACEINDSEKRARPFRATTGQGAHPLPEIALFKAVSEACQSRSAFIAGARDDLFPWLYAEPERSITIGFGLPLPPGMTGVDFSAVDPGPDTVPLLCSSLAAAGYADAAAIILAEPFGLCVVRAFVCGLGSTTRRRRLLD
jgi:ribosomal protein S12 methylthiotransferase accessory factor